MDYNKKLIELYLQNSIHYVCVFKRIENGDKQLCDDILYAITTRFQPMTTVAAANFVSYGVMSVE